MAENLQPQEKRTRRTKSETSNTHFCPAGCINCLHLLLHRYLLISKDRRDVQNCPGVSDTYPPANQIISRIKILPHGPSFAQCVSERTAIPGIVNFLYLVRSNKNRLHSRTFNAYLYNPHKRKTPRKANRRWLNRLYPGGGGNNTRTPNDRC